MRCLYCGKEIKVFGESHIDEIAKQFGLKVLAKLPIDPELASLCDKGLIELFDRNWLQNMADVIENTSK